MTGECSTCHAPIIWAVTQAGKAMPCDPPARVPDGVVPNVAILEMQGGRARVVVLKKGQTLADIDPEELGYALTVAHFVTCPKVDMHRQARRGDLRAEGVIPFPRGGKR